jgi:hypothetical protein
MIVVPFRSKFVDEVVNDEEEPYTYQKDPSITERMPFWNSAFLDILAEHFDPDGVKNSEIPAEMQEWKNSMAKDQLDVGEFLDNRVEFTGSLKDCVNCTELAKEYIDEFRGGGALANQMKNVKEQIRSYMELKGGVFAGETKIVRDADGKSHRNAMRRFKRREQQHPEATNL